MGLLTFDQIVTEGMELGGNTGLTTRCDAFLKAWISKEWAKWPWPFLQSRYGPVNVAAGVSSYDTAPLGSISHIRRVLIADVANNGYKGELVLYDDRELDAQDDPLWSDSSSPGLPFRVVVTPVLSADKIQTSWLINFDHPTDKAYRLIIVAQSAPVITDTTKVINYPNDETLIQAVFCYVLKHQEDSRASDEEAKLRGMVNEDRVTYGKQPSQRRITLAKHRFRSRR